MFAQLLTVISSLGGAIIGSGIAGIVLNNHYLTKQENTKRKRNLLDELIRLCFQVQKFCTTALEGVYPINEFSFEPLEDIQNKIITIVIMDFEGKLSHSMNEYFSHIKKFQISIEEFHSLFVANPSVDDPLIKSKRDQNYALLNDSMGKLVDFIMTIKKVSEKL